jgi:hypothetical protein
VNKAVWVLVGLVVALTAYDIYAVTNGKSGDTISEVIRWLSQRPIVPFLFGLICGHLFWTR